MQRLSTCLLVFLLSSVKAHATEDPDLLVKVEPVYPIEAREAQTEGWVLLEFDITKLGAPINVVAIDSFPKRIFESAAIKAVKQWRYNPAFYPESRETLGFRVKLEFKLEKTIKELAY